MAETTVLEIVDDADQPCAPGEAGRVLLTDLHHFATPLVRDDCGDFAVAAGPCPCGRGLPTLQRIAGRRRNLLLKPDGSRHWPMLGLHRLHEAAPVQQFQAVQRARDHIKFRVVTAEPLDAAQRQALVRIVQDALGYRPRVDVVHSRERLPRAASGKFEEFINAIDAG